MNPSLRIATACFCRKNNKTLLIDYTNSNHPIHAGKFSPPGGKLELETKDENIESGTKRELFEETNILDNSLVYRGVITFLNEKRTINGFPMKHNWEVHFFDCFNFDESKAKCEEGKISWIENDEVMNLPLHEGDKIMWEWLNKYKEIEAEIIHTGEKLTRSTINSYVPFD